MSASSVMIYITMALEYLDSPYRVDDVEPNLVQAEQRLANLNPADAAPLLEQIASIRARLDEMVKPEDARQVKAAQGKLRQARDFIDTNGGRLNQSAKDSVEELFKVAIQYLEQITDARKADKLKAPVLAEIDRIRQEYSTNNTAKPASPPKPATPPPPSQDYHNAKRAVFWANDYFGSGRTDQAESEVNKAEGLLRGDNSAEAAELALQIAQLRRKLADEVSSEDKASVRAAEGKLRQIRNHVETNNGRVYDSDKEFFEQLCRGAVEYLDKITHAYKADELKAPVLAEMARIRAQYGLTGPATRTAPAPAPLASAIATPPPPSQKYQEAKRKVFWANDYFSNPSRIEQTEPELAQASQLLQDDASREADDLRAEIEALRAKLADMVMPSDQGHVRAAERDVRRVRDYMGQYRDRLYKDDVKQDLDKQLQSIIDGTLTKITAPPRKADEIKAPVLSEIARLRSLLGLAVTHPQPTTYYSTQAQPPPPPSPSPPANVDTDTLSYEDQDRLKRAKQVIGQARIQVESYRSEDIDSLLYDATRLLAPIGDTYKRHFLDEMEELRKEAEANRVAEATRTLTGVLDRKLGMVKDGLDRPTSDMLKPSIHEYKQRFAQDDVRRILTPELYRDYEQRFDNLLAQGAANLLRETLAKAEPALQQLWDKLATNPFTGLDDYNANRMDGELRSMRWKVEKEIKLLPEDDTDRLRLYAELARVDAKWAEHSDAWAKAGIHEAVRNGWQMIRNQVQGWEQEQEKGEPLEDPEMPLTRLTIRRAHYYLDGDSYVQRTREENPGDPAIAAVDREAAQLLDAAGTKMASAFDRLMDAAERLPTPIEDQWLRGKPSHLITSAESTFEGTRFCSPVVARVRALEKRWVDDLAAVREGRKNLGETLAAEALHKWPSVVAAIPGVVVADGFDPSSARPGETVLFRAVYNRAGWDFDGGQYGFSMRFHGVPLGGVYEPYVNAALDHAVYELKLAVDDHTEWDLVGVVLGPGTIKERAKKTIRIGMDTHEVEEWIPVPCLRMRVAALRAGPVVVGPPA